MWSSQRYRNGAKKNGLSNATIESAIAQIEEVAKGFNQLPAILTLNHLAQRTGVEYGYLRGFVSNTYEHAYRKFEIKKRSPRLKWTNSFRVISVPTPHLRQAQKWIATHILSKVSPHASSQAFAPGNSIVSCAREHREAKWLIKLDIHDFFGSISEIQAYRVYRSLGYRPLISFELARLSTYRAPASTHPIHLERWFRRPPGLGRKRLRVIAEYDHRFVGCLPQGAPTSPMLANLVMRTLDQAILEIAVSLGLTYTRYSDDLTFSTRLDFDRERASELIRCVAKLLRPCGLFLNIQKTTVVPPGARKIVLGLLVDGEEPRLSRQFKDRIRQHFYYLEKWGVREHVAKRGFDSIGGFFRHLKGLLDFANMVEPEYARKLYERFHSLTNDRELGE
jgi:RNA-directed DNA polymerase